MVFGIPHLHCAVLASGRQVGSRFTPIQAFDLQWTDNTWVTLSICPDSFSLCESLIRKSISMGLFEFAILSEKGRNRGELCQTNNEQQKRLQVEPPHENNKAATNIRELSDIGRELGEGSGFVDNEPQAHDNQNSHENVHGVMEATLLLRMRTKTHFHDEIAGIQSCRENDKKQGNVEGSVLRIDHRRVRLAMKETADPDAHGSEEVARVSAEEHVSTRVDVVGVLQTGERVVDNLAEGVLTLLLLLRRWVKG